MTMRKANGDPFLPTPREQAVMDQNMAHARNCVHNLVGNVENWAGQGVTGDELRDKTLDMILAESDVTKWPGQRITEEVAVIAMLIEAAVMLAHQ